MSKAKCDDCEWIGDANDVKEIHRFWERVEAGCEMPSGECPECGALAYPVKEPTEPLKNCLKAALLNFLGVWTADKNMLSDLGPVLTCSECEVLAELFEALNPELYDGAGCAKALREGHCRKDEEGDSETHLKIKAALEAHENH